VLFRIDPSGAEPLAAQIASQIRSAAIRGELAPGTRLPAARDVAEALGVNLHTVLHAYRDVRDEGLLELRPGRGAVLTTTAHDVRSLHDAIDSVVSVTRELGISPTTTLALMKEALQ
jgi:GntR family transcriptional regulator